jgi:2-oxoglutarate ferredoxin oxidoreductase subunit gamma
VERELVMSGIGGQGVQLASSVLAAGAFADGLEVQVFGSYGGMMRGGATEATVVLADEPIEAPPTLATAWSVLLMHHEHSEQARGCLAPGSILFVNSTIVPPDIARPDIVTVEVPATELARDMGHPVAASLIMLGAYATATGVVRLASLVEAVGEVLPPYRSQHREPSERALAAGASAVDASVVAAWPAGVAG